MHLRKQPLAGLFPPLLPDIQNYDREKGIAGYPKNNRYQTWLTSLIPVVLLYTDQKKEKIQIGVWPCLLALLEIFFFLIKTVVVEEIHIFIFIIQSQFVFLTLGG